MRYRAVSEAKRSGKTLEEIQIDYHFATTCMEELKARVKSLESQLQGSKNRNTALSRDLDHQKELVKRQTIRVEKFKRAYSALKESSSYRLGYALTFPTRKLRRLSGRVKSEVRRKTNDSQRVIFEVEDQNHPPQDQSADVLRVSARRMFQIEGAITQPLELLKSLGASQSDTDKVFIRQLQGLLNLIFDSPEIPIHQSNPGYKPLRGSILYCAHSTGRYNSNGYSNRTAGLVHALQQVVQVTVVARPGYPWDSRTDMPAPAPIRTVENISGVRHVFNPGPSLKKQPLDEFIYHSADVIAYEAILARAEVIHAASNHITALPALIAARRLGIPFVYEVRGLWEITQAASNPVWASSERHELAVRLESLVAQSADEVLAITRQVAERLISRGTSKERISILPNAADPYRFAPLPKDKQVIRELGLVESDIVVGYAGSLVEYEGVEGLIDAFNEAVQTEPNLRLLIVGDGPLLTSVTERAADSSWSHRITITGRKQSDSLPQYVSAMDIVVCPRLSNEITEMVSPLKPLEAFSAGKALLAANVAPLADLCGVNQERGVLFEPGNVSELAQCLVALGRNEQRRGDLGRRARRWINDESTWPKMAEKVQNAHARARARAYDGTSNSRQLGSIRIGLISDEFTEVSLSGECEIIKPTPQDWQSQLEFKSIDALLVESAWAGNDGSWHRKVGYYDDSSSKDLKNLLDYCRAKGIPTIFWNKEDPVHFNRFVKTAENFDHVFTTDAQMVPEYLANRTNQRQTVASLPFWANWRVHNPLPVTRNYSESIAYAGTYYGDRFPERSKVLLSLLESVATDGLTIYDRQASVPNSPYEFPQRMQKFVSRSLPYEEMLEAYKSHAAHINVNSVLTSTTMFSRRVVELAACGTPVLSGPGVGVTTLFSDLVPTVVDPRESSALAHMWINNERERTYDGWRIHRHVYRAHLAEHRLAYMLRTAGIPVSLPELRPYTLVIEKLDDLALDAILEQTHRPRFIKSQTVELESSGVHALVDANISVLSGGSVSPLEIEIHLGNLPVDKTVAEDLCRASVFHPGTVELDFRSRRAEESTLYSWRENESNIDAPVYPKLVQRNTGNDLLTKLNLHGYRDESISSDFPPTGLALSPILKTGSKTVLFAGHDFKFAQQIVEALRKTGHNVIFDHWDDHDNHDAVQSSALISQADVVFCEWSLGNAVWYSQNLRPNQRLVVRFHSQELFTQHTSRVNLGNIDHFVFVGEFVRQMAIRRFGLSSVASSVIPNILGVAPEYSDIDPERRFVLGMAGIVPQQKRLDRALNILSRLRETDERFRLQVKGRLPNEYPWMERRPFEAAYFESQFERIRLDKTIASAVDLLGYGQDMPEWYRHIGHTLSVSNFESFHLTVADGAVSGAIPHILSWPGSEGIYPQEWIHMDEGSIVDRIRYFADRPDEFVAKAAEVRKSADQRFDSESTLKSICSRIIGNGE